MKTLRLILGDQLNPEHSWLRTVDSNTHYVMMEVRQETDYVMHHAQKVIAIFAAMREFAKMLVARGHQVSYITIDDPANTHSMTDNLSMLARELKVTAIEYQSPDEWRLDDQLKKFEQTCLIAVRMVDSEHFYTERDTASNLFKARKRWLMEHFYRTMRQTHQVLMDGSEPVGGQWNFDADNRKPWKSEPTPPADNRPKHDHSALWKTIESSGIKTFGRPQAHAFQWPINRQEALAQLHDFIDHVLPHFGDYQDAMHSEQPFLFHSLISFALNTKMLHPREVIDAAQHAWQQGQAPIAATEGFIRQILGWREYVRGVYWSQMPGYTQKNALDHQTPMPDWFWTGQTKMRCLSHAIGQSLDTAYAHHIQRLMVIGNFALLAGIDPAAVHRWYLGVYIDAFEWVEAPNTLGMSQFADDGLLATKPYVSSAAYINRMSDYCKGCHYDKKERVGDRACPFNALYWDFYERHESKFSNNPRIGMAYRQLAKMSRQDRAAISEQAMIWRKNINYL